MQIFELDCHLLKPMKISLNLKANTRSLASSLNGSEQVINGRRASWVCELTLRAKGIEAVRYYRSLLAKLDGRTNALCFCPCDPYSFNLKNAGFNYSNGLPYFESLVPHSDGAGFEFEPVLFASETAVAGSSKLTFNVSDFPAQGLDEGVYFSINHFLYLITDIRLVFGKKQVSFMPNLRQAVTPTTQIDLKPHVAMRLSEDLSGAHTRINAKQMEEVTLSLVEVFGR